MKRIKSLLSLCLAAVVAACGGSDDLKIVADIDGLGTQSVVLNFYNRSGVSTVSIPVVDGHLEYTSSSKEPVMVELRIGNRRTLGYLMAQNGQEVKAYYKLGDTGATSISGNDVSRRLGRFCAANGALIDSLQPEKLNRAIEAYVAENPNDQVSSILVTRYYDPSADPAGAARLLRTIAPEARPASIIAGYTELVNVTADSLKTLPPMRLYTLDDSLRTIAPHDTLALMLVVNKIDVRFDRDSITEALNAIADSLSKHLTVVELLEASDTLSWHRVYRTVKPKYIPAWMPGGVASPAVRELNIKSLPAVIMADSTGVITYRGASVEECLAGFTAKTE